MVATTASGTVAGTVASSASTIASNIMSHGEISKESLRNHLEIIFTKEIIEKVFNDLWRFFEK